MANHKEQRNKMLMKKFCPNCESENIQMIAGGIVGSWMCADCGFSGSVFPEKEVNLKEKGEVGEKNE